MKKYHETRRAGYGVYDLYMGRSNVQFGLVTKTKTQVIYWDYDGNIIKIIVQVNQKKYISYDPVKNNIREIMENMSPIFVKMMARVYEGIFEA